MENFAITEAQSALVRALLTKHLPQTTVWLYGSRITGTSRPASDLDMVVFIDKAQRPKLADLKEAFEESRLPFRVAVFAWDELPEHFQSRIQKEHLVFVQS